MQVMFVFAWLVSVVPTRIHVRTCYCVTRGHVFSRHKKTCIMVGQEGMHYCATPRHVSVLHRRTCVDCVKSRQQQTTQNIFLLKYTYVCGWAKLKVFQI